MAKRVKLDLELPDEILARLERGEIEKRVKQALVMDLLREHQLSQGKAADLLGLNRHELFDLMAKHHIPVIDLSAEELKSELQKPLPRD